MSMPAPETITITLKQPTGKTEKIEINPQQTLNDYTDTFSAFVKCPEDRILKVLFNGKTMQLFDKFADLGIKNGSFVVVTTYPKPKTTQPPPCSRPPSPSPSPSPSPIIIIESDEDEELISPPLVRHQTNHYEPTPRTQTYSYDQIRITLAFVFNWLHANPETAQLFATNPSQLTDFLMSPSFGSILDPLLSNSDTLLDRIQDNPDINIGIIPGAAPQFNRDRIILPTYNDVIQPQPQLQPQLQPQPQDFIRLLMQTIQAGNPELLQRIQRLGPPDQVLDHMMTDINHDHEHKSFEPTPEDDENIANIVAITNVDKSLAHDMYFQSGRDVTMTIEALMGLQ